MVFSCVAKFAWQNICHGIFATEYFGFFLAEYFGINFGSLLKFLFEISDVYSLQLELIFFSPHGGKRNISEEISEFHGIS